MTKVERTRNKKREEKLCGHQVDLIILIIIIVYENIQSHHLRLKTIGTAFVHIDRSTSRVKIVNTASKIVFNSADNADKFETAEEGDEIMMRKGTFV